MNKTLFEKIIVRGNIMSEIKSTIDQRVERWLEIDSSKDYKFPSFLKSII